MKDGYPFSPKQKHAPEYVREHLHLRSRIDYIAAQMRVRHRAQKVIHDYMDELNFVQIDTPILTANDCEGAGEVSLQMLVIKTPLVSTFSISGFSSATGFGTVAQADVTAQCARGTKLF